LSPPLLRRIAGIFLLHILYFMCSMFHTLHAAGIRLTRLLVYNCIFSTAEPFCVKKRTEWHHACCKKSPAGRHDRFINGEIFDFAPGLLHPEPGAEYNGGQYIAALVYE